jgi:hypothetical protein
MPSRIVTYAHRTKRPPWKRKAAALPVPAIVTKATRRKPADTPPVTAADRKRSKVNRADRPELPDDPEADARVKAFFARMVRPGGAAA